MASTLYIGQITAILYAFHVHLTAILGERYSPIHLLQSLAGKCEPDRNRLSCFKNREIDEGVLSPSAGLQHVRAIRSDVHAPHLVGGKAEGIPQIRAENAWIKWHRSFITPVVRKFGEFQIGA